jgi:lysophospholipase L1-like esterase
MVNRPALSTSLRERGGDGSAPPGTRLHERPGGLRCTMDLGLRLASAVGMFLFPVLVLQGRQVRRTVPRLPEAAGPKEGEVAGALPAIRLLVLGESTVAGVGAPTHDDGLAGHTARALARATGRAVRWRALGRNGATADITRRELLEPAADLRADVAVIALGVNDTLRFHGPGRWTRDLHGLIAALRARCGEIPIVLSAVPPAGRVLAFPRLLRTTLGLRAQLLDRAAVRLARRSARVSHVPTPPWFLDAIDRHFCEDGFHPSPSGYALWGRLLGDTAGRLYGR